MRFTVPELVSIVVGLATLAFLWRAASMVRMVEWYAVNEIEVRTTRLTGPLNRRRRRRPTTRRRSARRRRPGPRQNSSR
jgi:hypothetical protein